MESCSLILLILSLQCQVESVVRCRGKCESIDDRGDIEHGTADKQRHFPPRKNVFNHSRCCFLIPPDCHFLCRILHIEEVMGNVSHFLPGDFCCANIQASVELTGIRIHDFASDRVCKLERERSFPRCCRAKQNKERFFGSFQKNIDASEEIYLHRRSITNIATPYCMF